MTEIFISGGRALLGAQIHEASLEIGGGRIGAVDGPQAHSACEIDASGLLVLPGIVDLHGWRSSRRGCATPYFRLTGVTNNNQNAYFGSFDNSWAFWLVL